jgi:hypothetical protein
MWRRELPIAGYADPTQYENTGLVAIDMTRVAVSWSRGRDSYLACYKALQKGVEASYPLNFISKDGRCISHGINSKSIVTQSQAIGTPSYRGRLHGRRMKEAYCIGSVGDQWTPQPLRI